MMEKKSPMMQIINHIVSKLQNTLNLKQNHRKLSFLLKKQY